MPMANIIYLESNPYQVRAAIEEDGSLAELFVERKGGERLVGNIYKGKVKNVLPGMQAAFFVSLTTLSLFVWAGLWYTEQNPAEHVFAGALIQQTGCEILR